MYSSGLFKLVMIWCLSSTCEVYIQDHDMSGPDCWHAYADWTMMTADDAGLLQWDCVQDEEFPQYQFIPDYVMLRELYSETLYQF